MDQMHGILKTGKKALLPYLLGINSIFIKSICARIPVYAAREYFDFFTPNNQTIFLTVKRNIKKLITVIHPKAIKGVFCH